MKKSIMRRQITFYAAGIWEMFHLPYQRRVQRFPFKQLDFFLQSELLSFKQLFYSTLSNTFIAPISESLEQNSA